MVLFFFMMVFMDTTATIPTGAMAERWSWKNFCLFGLWVALPYCLYANWVWGGGWLAQGGKNWGLGHGAVDFAGSGVVHAMGGVIALAGAMIIGPRIGKFDAQGRPRAMPGHNIPMAVLGTFILAFGWFGFNPGSTLSGTDLRISFVVVNTMLAEHHRRARRDVLPMIKGMKPDPTMMLQRHARRPGRDHRALCVRRSLGRRALSVRSPVVLVVVSVLLLGNAGVDDPVGAISVHGVNGLWGVISVGIFATGKYGAGWNGVVRDRMVKAIWLRRRPRACSTATPRSFHAAHRRRSGGGLRLRDGLCVVQDQRPDHAHPRQSEETELEGLEVRKWACWAIRISSSFRTEDCGVVTREEQGEPRFDRRRLSLSHKLSGADWAQQSVGLISEPFRTVFAEYCFLKAVDLFQLHPNGALIIQRVTPLND